MKYNLKKEKNYNLHTITTDNFRDCHFSLAFNMKFDAKKAVAFSLLSDILTDCSKNYPTSKYVIRHIDESFILDFYGTFSKTNNMMQAFIICDYIDPKYIDDKKYLDNVFKFIFDMLKNPLIIDNGFEEKNFEIVKQRFLSRLKSVAMDNHYIALYNAYKLFAPNTPLSFSFNDILDYINNITREELYDFYKELITKSTVDIFITSSTNKDILTKKISKYYPFDTKGGKVENKELVVKSRLIPKKKTLKKPYKQSTIVAILNIENITDFEREFVLAYYNNILNQAGLSSKLYQSMREEAHICYGVSTNYIEKCNSLLIQSTIKVGEEKKAISLIKKAIKDMKNNISNKEYIGAYYAYQSSLTQMVDSLGAINRLYMNMFYGNYSTYEKKQSNFKKIKIEDIYNLAKRVKLNTIFVLKGDINERNQD